MYDLVYDMQFGSTGKGLLAGHLALKHHYDTAITAFAPNAGHTFIDSDKRRMIHTQLANSVVSPKIRQVLISAGSHVNLDALKREIVEAVNLGYMGHPIDVCIHENAAICGSQSKEAEEATTNKIGSTQKGMGASMIQKIRRDPDVSSTFGQSPAAKYDFIWQHKDVVIKIVNNAEYLKRVMSADLGIIEGAQGFSLGINSGFYPYVTSRECTVSQIMSDTQVRGTKVRKIYGVARTFPIRVANRYVDGQMIGWSGPIYDDQRETSFYDIGVATEKTTVTKLPRRVFTFSDEQVRQCLICNDTDEIFLNFCNYLGDSEAVINMVNRIHEIAEEVGSEAKVTLTGWGPTTDNIVEYK